MQETQITFMALLLAYLLSALLSRSLTIVQHKSTSFWMLVRYGVALYILAWTCLLIFTTIPFSSIRSQFVTIGYLILYLLLQTLKHHLIARKRMNDNWETFLFTQLLHLIVLGFVSVLLAGIHVRDIIQTIRPLESTKTRILEVILVYAVDVFGGGYLIRHLTKGLAKNTVEEPQEQLSNAGLYVGWLERFLVITAVAMQSPALVGLILTGKSIARFPEFKETKFAEYFLIGTLLSIAISVVGGIAILQILYGTVSLK